MLDVTEIKGKNVDYPGWMVDVDIDTAFSIRSVARKLRWNNENTLWKLRDNNPEY